MTEPRQIMSETEMDQAVAAIAREIHEKASAQAEVMLVGIRTRGVPLAQWIAKQYKQQFNIDLPVGILDINLYRDDLSEVDSQPVVRQTELPGSVQDKGIILVDDVLFTGRTVRSALDALLDHGRPSFVQLAVMIDRGFRELPIQADYTGLYVETTLEENVKVLFTDTDGSNEIYVKLQKAA